MLVFGGLPGLQPSDGVEGFAEVTLGLGFGFGLGLANPNPNPNPNPKQVTVPASRVPHKPALLAELKSNNYLLEQLVVAHPKPTCSNN